MARLNRRANQQPPLAQIGAQASPGDFDLLFVDFTGTHLDGEDGLHFDDRETRDGAARAMLFDDPVHIFGPGLLVVQLRQGTRVEKIVWQSALLPLGDHGVGKGSGDFG